MIDVNVGAALWLTQAVVPYLRERGPGSIVHAAARPGLEPAAGMATSAVSKAAYARLGCAGTGPPSALRRASMRSPNASSLSKISPQIVPAHSIPGLLRSAVSSARS